MVKSYADELVALRRDLHAHPELSWQEQRTTAPGPGPPPGGRPPAACAADRHRADLRRRRGRPGRGAARRHRRAAAGRPQGRPLRARPSRASATPAVTTCTRPRCSAPAWCSPTSPARASCPGGSGCCSSRPRSRRAAAPGRSSTAGRSTASSGSSRCTAIRAPRWGRSGCASGAITASADQVHVRLTGKGGHTARPHLTGDLVFALGKVVTELPAALSRRVDPRSALSRGLGSHRGRQGAERHPRGG